jgi:hypothetical protein
LEDSLPLNTQDPDPQWIEKLREISDRCAARPVLDARSDDELVGYDEFGVPAIHGE